MMDSDMDIKYDDIAKRYFGRKVQVAADNTPEASLAVAVIIQSFVDWTKEFKSDKPNHDTFLNGENPMFGFWCNVAGLDTEFVKDKYNKAYNVMVARGKQQ